MSLFRKKQVNRRLGRVHVLDVKLRSDQVRQSRMRLVALAFGTIFGLVIGGYACWRGGEWVLNRVAYENPAFAITSVEAQTDGVIAPDQLRRWREVYDMGLRLKKGNLATLDLAVSNNVPARWVEASVPPQPVRIPKPPRNRRPNV